MPLDIQSKLLRLLQDNQYRPIGSNKNLEAKCRFVFATNREVENMIKEGSFREDLYYRINVFTINIPPLRERRDDIPVLLDYFIKKYSGEFNLPEKIQLERKAMERISNYSWPGNAREMENFVIRALAVLSSSKEDKEEVIVDGNYEEIMNQQSKKIIKWALEKANGNITMAAKILGIKRTTLSYKIKELGIE